MPALQLRDKNITGNVGYSLNEIQESNPFRHSPIQRLFAGNRFYLLTAFILFILLDAGAWLLAFIYAG